MEKKTDKSPVEEQQEWHDALQQAEGFKEGTRVSLVWIAAWRKTVEQMREFLHFNYLSTSVGDVSIMGEGFDDAQASAYKYALDTFNELFPKTFTTMEKTKAQIAAEEQKIPQDIQDAANEKYPLPEFSMQEIAPNIEAASFDYSLQSAYQSVYIQGRIEERVAATLKWRKIDSDNIFKGWCLLLTNDGIINMINVTKLATLIAYQYYIPISDLLQLDKED